MFQIDPMSREPVYEQIIQQVQQFILTDVLQPGGQIPSVRSVSMTNSINPRTILKAYTELDAKGLIQSVPGLEFQFVSVFLQQLRNPRHIDFCMLLYLILFIVSCCYTWEFFSFKEFKRSSTTC